MNREQKIEALIDEMLFGPSSGDSQQVIVKKCILAGIALRDAELLSALENHTIQAEDFRKCVSHNLTISHSLDGMYMSVMNALTVARQKDEQFMKAIKGDGDASNL